MFLQTDAPGFAECRSFFGWWRIWLGAPFITLPPDQQVAVMEHELAHVRMHHTEQRIFCLLLAPFLFSWLCRRQEFQADKRATRLGHGLALLRLLSDEKEGSATHPSHEARRNRITLELSTLRTISPGTT